ncbi:MAG: tetratricopeptide repeat protein, partial [Candidatus Eisenbacteria bacterium]|nr:tetratricopeptide repeat protein [Candidatus Eisenbacteria bacterium]
PGEVEAAGQYVRAIELGRASRTSEGMLAAVQSSIALAEQLVSVGRTEEAGARLRAAIGMSPSCDAQAVGRYVVLAEMRLGQTLGESDDRALAVEHLGNAYARGRLSGEPWVRELAAQAACSLHRVLCSLDRWAEARALAEDAAAFAGGLESPTGRALAAAANYARAFQKLHDGDAPQARALLAEVADRGFESGAEVGERVALDALLLAGHLDRQAGRLPEALAQFQRALRQLRGSTGHESDGLAAMAAVNSGHVLMALERQLESRYAYEQALERGRSSGTSTGRAAAANAALNLASMLEDEVGEDKRREWYGIALALGRSSRTTLGTECARNAEKGLAGLDGRGEERD